MAGFTVSPSPVDQTWVYVLYCHAITSGSDVGLCPLLSRYHQWVRCGSMTCVTVTLSPKGQVRVYGLLYSGSITSGSGVGLCPALYVFYCHAITSGSGVGLCPLLSRYHQGVRCGSMSFTVTTSPVGRVWVYVFYCHALTSRSGVGLCLLVSRHHQWVRCGSMSFTVTPLPVGQVWAYVLYCHESPVGQAWVFVLYCLAIISGSGVDLCPALLSRFHQWVRCWSLSCVTVKLSPVGQVWAYGLLYSDSITSGSGVDLCPALYVFYCHAITSGSGVGLCLLLLRPHQWVRCGSMSFTVTIISG